MKDIYESPLAGRYASKYMLHLFSADTRYETWRKLWAALAEAESKLGLDISKEQVDELYAHITDIDYDVVSKREKEIRHDVMAHIYAYGEVAPKAKSIIHLGATSCFVTDNADLIIYRDALIYLKDELKDLLGILSDFADKYKALPTLGYTHYQPAQPVTVGKRAALWIQDFFSDLKDLIFVLEDMKFRGAQGATGTQASFMDLFNKDEEKIRLMNEMIKDKFGFKEVFDVCGQTYPRKQDMRILNVLSSLAVSAHKMATDIRLLQHDRELEEPFETHQVGSSAMPYKQNPMRSERICSLSRFLMADALNAPMTAANQWLERTLDDSANRRISMPEAFLTADGILRLCINVVSGLKVNEKVIESHLREYLPFIATENIMMEAVKKGADRGEIHAIIRKCTLKATSRMKEGKKADLIGILASEPGLGLKEADLKAILEPDRYIGRAASQVDNFLKKIRPLIETPGNSPYNASKDGGIEI